MKQKSLRVRCVFAPTGEDARELILCSFSQYLHRILAQNDAFSV